MITAKTAGFCFGVEKAVGAVYELVENAGRRRVGQTGSQDSAAASANIVTYGPIIHNEVVVEDLRRRGVGVINKPEEISSHAKGTIVIRSHGVSHQLYDTIQNSGARVVDTTCTFVKRIHEIVAADSAAGAQVVIIGNHGHAEVEGHKGWCKDPLHHPAIVIETSREAQSAPLAADVPVSVVAQTTFHEERFAELVDILRGRGFELRVHNTICNATRERQEEARKIAAKVDVMLVIGGRSSSNTAKLYDICKSVCPHTMLIQTVRDLIPVQTAGQAAWTDKGQRVQPAAAAGADGSPDAFAAKTRNALPVRHPKKIGITAGASTPKTIIEEVQSYVRGADF